MGGIIEKTFKKILQTSNITDIISNKGRPRYYYILRAVIIHTFFHTGPALDKKIGFLLVPTSLYAL
jgi:hypothetical protein